MLNYTTRSLQKNFNHDFCSMLRKVMLTYFCLKCFCFYVLDLLESLLLSNKLSRSRTHGKNGITKNRARSIFTFRFTVVSHIRVPHQDSPWKSKEKSLSVSREPDVCKILPCKCHLIKCASFLQDLHPGTCCILLF